MAREKMLRVAALNIVLQPHSRQLYAKLFEAVSGPNASHMKFRGSHFAMIGSRRRRRDEEGIPLYYRGEIYRFADIDHDQPWLNLSKGEAADEDDLQQVQIPRHLRPEFSSCRYFFDLRIHRFFFEARSDDGATFGPTSVAGFMKRLLNQPELKAHFGEVRVTIEPAKEGLERLLSLPGLSRLEIVARRPNPDDFGSYEREFYDRLDNQNADRIEENLIAQRGREIKPDQQTRYLAQIGASNGHVKAVGRDVNNRRIEESSEDHPWVEQGTFAPDVQDGSSAFQQIVRSMTAELPRRFRRRRRR